MYVHVHFLQGPSGFLSLQQCYANSTSWEQASCSVLQKITELCFKTLRPWTFWCTKTKPSSDSVLPVLSKNVAGYIVPYKIICFLCKNSCNKIMNIRCLFLANVLTLHKMNTSTLSPEQHFLLLMPWTHKKPRSRLMSWSIQPSTSTKIGVHVF